jgi:hypothetical protein
MYLNRTREKVGGFSILVFPWYFSPPHLQSRGDDEQADELLDESQRILQDAIVHSYAQAMTQ